MREADFICAICRRDVSMRWNFGHSGQRILPPLCWCCEGHYSQGIGRPSGGSFRDRREVMRGFALAEALNSEAHAMQWRGRYEA